jgi:two-component sensor histidine kinase
VALIVTELVTNALKYAYPCSQGVIQVSLAIEGSGRLRLTVEDAGVGLPLANELRESFGLLMARTLARQLNAELLQESASPGTRFKLVFATQESSEAPELT